MARLTQILFPLALLSLLISIASANYEANYETQNFQNVHHDDQISHENLVNHDEKPLPQYTESFIPIEPGHPKTEQYQIEEGPDSEIDYIGIRGVILCRSGSNYTPIKGAVARILCLNGFSVLSPETDENGYFLKEISVLEIVQKLINAKECKAILEHSPLKHCNVATHKGLTGAPLSLDHTEPGKNIYTVGTLFYSNSVPSNGY